MNRLLEPRLGNKTAVLSYNYLLVVKSRDSPFLYLASLPFKMLIAREFALLKISFFFSTSAAIDNLILNLISLNNNVQQIPQ